MSMTSILKKETVEECTLDSTGLCENVALAADTPAGGPLTATAGGALSSSCLLFHFEIKLAA
jgi:hypothetical protein